MEVELLGAHSTETAGNRMTSILIDGVLALDAGGLCSGLTLSAQQKLKAIFLTHYHYDHVRDIPNIAMNVSRNGVIDVYSTVEVFDVLSTYLLDGKMYPNFLEWPEEQPAIRFTIIEPYKPFSVSGYNISAVTVPHSIAAVGFQVTCPAGRKIFYTGDTGEGLSVCWDYVSPDLLITELSFPNEKEDWARKVGHLTPGLLKAELLKFRNSRGYIPATLTVHLNPFYENTIETEVSQIAAELGASITLGREGMKIQP